MLNAHSAILGDIGTSIGMGAILGLNLGPVTDADSTSLGLVGASLGRTQLDLGTMFFTNTARLCLVGTPLGRALISVFEFRPMTDTDSTGLGLVGTSLGRTLVLVRFFLGWGTIVFIIIIGNDTLTFGSGRGGSRCGGGGFNGYGVYR